MRTTETTEGEEKPLAALTKMDLRPKIKPIYGDFSPEHVTPPDGNYSFIEWEDVDIRDGLAIAIALVGEPLSSPVDSLEEILRSAVVASHGPEDLLSIAEIVRRMNAERLIDRVTAWKEKMDVYFDPEQLSGAKISLLDKAGNVMAFEWYVHGKATTFKIPLTGMVASYRLENGRQVLYEGVFEQTFFAAQFSEITLDLVPKVVIK